MKPLKWWQQAVFYQIYPRSFADGNGDGIGDFAGMAARLPHLRELGVDAIWLSPHYPSPYIDCGYDISDYTGVAPEYGTLDDFKTFLDTAHALGLRVILDLVLNHTSDQHPWFIESRSSRDNPKRDWYIWRDGKAGGPPTNWASIFGGTAWDYDAATDQYYYHAFLKEQPDLNWRNPEVKQAMWQAVRFWLDLGVDGFRLDAIGTIYEHPDLPDHALQLSLDEIYNATLLSAEEYETLMAHQVMQPGVHELMKELRALLDEYPGERVLVGEDDNVAFHGGGDDELHLVFNFPLMRPADGRLTPAHVRANQAARLAALPAEAWPCNTLGNHDTPRSRSRYGDGQHDAALARLHLAMLLTLKGTPFLYYGEEIGMTDLELNELEQIRDTAALHFYQALTQKVGAPTAEALASALRITRDRCRSPFQWDAGPNGGFCPAGVTPWLPVHANCAAGVNVAAQLADPDSHLAFIQRLLRLRRAAPALTAGDYQDLAEGDPHCLVFARRAPGAPACLVALNFSAEPQPLPAAFHKPGARLLLSSAPRAHLTEGDLQPFEVLIAEIE